MRTNALSLRLTLVTALAAVNHADAYSVFLQPPNGYRLPKAIGDRVDPVPLTGYDCFDWLGITHHRTGFKPSVSLLPLDSSVNSASAFTAASKAIRQDPLRQATSFKYCIDRNHFYIEFNSDLANSMQHLVALSS